MSNTITNVHARAIQNSRGSDVIAVTVEAGEYEGTFALPEGASTGSKEVHAADASSALLTINEVVAPAFKGKRIDDQKGIDALLHELDPTPSLIGIGGNVALGVSVGACKAAAKMSGQETWEYIRSLSPLAPQGKAPRLFMNLINGGKHANMGSAIQEHQIIPDTDDIEFAYASAVTVQTALQEILMRAYALPSIGKGDEGGFVIPSKQVLEPFDHLQEAIERSALPIAVSIGADIAASSFYKEGAYMLDNKRMTAEDLLGFYDELHAHIPNLHMVEDPFYEADGLSYAAYLHRHQDVLVIGDDLTTTNADALQHAIKMQAITGIIIKPNQIGTLSDTLYTMEVAYAHKVRCIVSHRSGETMDDFIADLAWATGAYGLKAGAPHAAERDAKYRRLIQIQKNNNA